MMLPFGVIMTGDDGPTYDLLGVQRLIRLRRYDISGEVTRTLGRDGFDEDDFFDCFVALKSADFYKTMASEKDGKTMLDVYRPSYCGRRVYIKFKLYEHDEGERLYVLSFKEDDQQ
jgi:hypothetical protein